MTRYRAIQLAITTLGIVAAASSVRAHHSHATFYDPCRSLTLEGRLERIQWKEPHILLDLKLDDGTTYHAEWMGLRGLTDSGGLARAQDALTFDARVVIVGNLLREAAQIRASVAAYTPDTRGPNLIDVTQIRRVDSSWRVEQQGPPCAGK